MGEFRVHHVRFFEYTPQAVQCMAYNKENEKLALSRSGGSIELWNVQHSWYQEEIIPGSEGQSIEALVWQGARLFCAGLDGNITEIDLIRLQPKISCSSDAGPVWCLTSNSAGTQLVAGTEDGCVVLLDTEFDQLKYARRFDSQESRILCIDWHKTEDIIVTGGVDNIRLWSVKSGRAIQRLTLGRQDRNKETVVWCVAILSDMTIVSGDSRGKTSFWNGKQGTIIKSIQSHKADVYCLAVHQSESTVVVSGVDSAVIQFNFIAARENSDWKDWVGSFVHNQHSHDVRAVQIVGETIVTGGVDTGLIQFRLKKSGAKNMWKKLKAIPHKPLVKVAKDVNVMLLQYPTYLEVWRLGYTDRSGVHGDILPLRSNPIKLIQLKSRGGNKVHCCDISKDASVMAYSDCDTVRVYKIDIDNITSIQPVVEMKRILTNQESPLEGAHCTCFTSDSKKLVTITSSSRLQIISVAAERVETEFTFPHKSDSLHLLSLSADDIFAAVADHTCNVHVYNLHTQQHLCSVPQYSCQASALAFSPDSTQLVMAYTDQKILEFSISQQEYSNWSKLWSQKFMKTWLKRQSKISHIVYNPSNPDQIFLHDEQMFCILDKTQPFPDNDCWQTLCTPNPNKPSAFHICNKYKFLFFLDVLPDNWIVAVERPPLELFKTLPDALRKKKFGT